MYSANLIHESDFPFEKYSTVVDVGGGIGAFALPLVQTYKHIKVTLQDLPGTLIQTRSVSDSYCWQRRRSNFPRFGRENIPRQWRRIESSL